MAVEAAAIQVTLPAMGESVTEGTILEWHKQEGDTIEADEILVEISTDKVDAEVPSPASGTIVKIHFAEGDTVTVGSVLADIAVGAGAGGSPNGSGNGGSPSATAEAPAGGDGASVDGDGATGEILDITTPAGGESVTEGTILEWSVKVGDSVEDGDTVVEISTDKVDMELPAPAAGTITEILAEEGATVTVGQVIARMQVGAGGSSAEVTAPADGQPAQASPNGAGGTAPAAVPSDAKAT
ncbi:MAG: 2-oxoglutarate dehydrogenase, subunit, partial [Conexibacter sp.]|nr:2-oxoglutarate dehydrogenase, subunit [Conexibacter sp.]